MQVTQIYEILNDIMAEVTGLPIVNEATPVAGQDDQGRNLDADGNVIREYIVQEDLSNIVQIGEDIFDNNWKDNYVKAMINRIGRSVFVDRTYTGYAPDILMDSWEYGSVMAKTRCKIFDAKANPSWSLEKGQTVNQFEFTPPDVTQKFYNNKVAWQIDCSFTDLQIRESMSSASELNRFYSMIENRINTSKTIYLDSLKMRTINNFIGEKIAANNGVVDLLAGYNLAFGQSLTAEKAMTNKDFLRYAAGEIKNYIEFFRAPSAAFNIPADEDGNVTFTPREFAKLVMISRVATGLEVYLQSDTYHDDLVKLGTFDKVPFWQSEGNGFDLETTTRINIKLASDNTKEIDRAYIIGVLFDRDALGVLCDNQRTTTAYNANGEYWTNFYKVDTNYFNDLAENGIVFVLGNGIPNVTTSPMPQTATIWDYSVSDLQSADFKVDNNAMKITGTLAYISEGALPPTWGNGNFMALQWSNIPEDATSVKIGITNLVEIINDPDRNGTVKVSDTSQKLRVITKTPNGTNTQLYDLSGITLAAAPQQENEAKKTTKKS